jgi:hypothetical protein
VKRLTIEQQIDLLRPAVRSGLARRFHWWLLGVAVVLLVVAAVTWHPVPLMIALFLGVVGVAERQAGPNLDRAVRAFDEGEPSNGTASITIVGGDTTDHYHVILREEGRPDSEFEFMPQGWEPAEGSFPARIWRADEGGIPVLATIDGGVLIPRRR